MTKGFWRRLIALTRKETRELLRDNSSLALGVVLPLVLILIIGYGMSLDVKEVPTAVVLEDSSPFAREAVRFTQGAEYFAPVYVTSLSEGEAMLRRHEADAMLVVPPDFSARFAEGRAKMQVILNGTEATTAMSAQGYFEAGVLTWAAGEGAKRGLSPGGIAIESRIWFNDANTSTWFYVPGILMLVLTISGVFLTSVVMAREWERGTFESLFVTPMKILELILSKTIPYFVIAMLGMVLCLVVGAARQAGSGLFDLCRRRDAGAGAGGCGIIPQRVRQPRRSAVIIARVPCRLLRVDGRGDAVDKGGRIRRGGGLLVQVLGVAAVGGLRRGRVQPLGKAGGGRRGGRNLLLCLQNYRISSK